MSPAASPPAASPAAAPAGGAVDSALREAERVVKKQKTCAARTSDAVSRLLGAVQAARDRLAADPAADAAPALRALREEVDALAPAAQMTADTKELHGAVAKLGKVRPRRRTGRARGLRACVCAQRPLGVTPNPVAPPPPPPQAVDAGFSLDVCAALRDVPMDRAALDQAVASHLYHEGAFEAGDAFAAEARVEGGGELKAPYAEMHAVLERLARRDVGPALAWAAAHAAELRGGSGGGGGGGGGGAAGPPPPPSDLEFALHRLAFLQLLGQQRDRDALAYAAAHLPAFRHSHLAQVQRLMGALAFSRRPRSPASPYADLFDDGLWADAARDFARQACALLGRAQDSPLLVAVAAGGAALPTLLKLASLVSQGGTAELGGDAAGQLPVEVPLGREFVFHSVFACPVSREQAAPDNPAMMLPCGHCLCRQSIVKIARAGRAFKCPYCPVEATLAQCVELRFPEAP
jgi:hypothetical protein